MNIVEFYNNPMGKGSTVLNIRATKADFDKRYDKISKDVNHTTYFIKKDIYISINIPSSVKGIFYDVVIKFTPNRYSAGVAVTDMDFQVFSNSPSFLYTYANTYAKRKMLIRELDRKLSREMLKNLATTRNPYSIVSYDFTVYAALKYIFQNGHTNINSLKVNCIESNSLTPLLKSVQDWETLQKKRKIQKGENKRLEEEERKSKLKEIKSPQDKKKTGNQKTDRIKASKTNKQVKNVKVSKKKKSI